MTLFESSDALGGRARSFTDPASGLLIDNCQHVILGCCTEAIGFLRRIGTLDQVTFHDIINIVDPSPPSGCAGRFLIQASRMPAPLHLLPAIARTGYLSGKDKRALTRVLVGMPARKPEPWERAADYLDSLGCPHSLIDRLVEPVVVSALNEKTHEASARYVRMVLLESLLKGRLNYRLGVPGPPHRELIEEAAARRLMDGKCEIRLNSRVVKAYAANNRIRHIELASGEQLSFDAYVMAVSPAVLRKLGLSTKGGRRLCWRPIVSAHLFFHTSVPEFEPVCVVGEPFGWEFSKKPDVRYVQVVASAAEAITGLDKGEILGLALRSARAAEPRLTSIPLQRGVVYRAVNATFATLSCDEHRPSAITSMDNLFLAGDWTATGWPATIESAVRSGRAAARAVAGAARAT